MTWVGPDSAFAIFKHQYEGPEEANPYLGAVNGTTLAGGPLAESIENLLGNLRGAREVTQLGEQIICHAEAIIELPDEGTCDAMFLLSAYRDGGYSIVRPFSRTILRGPDEPTARVIWHTERDKFRPVDKTYTHHGEEPIRLLARLLTEES